MENAHDVLLAATDIVGGARQAQHGDKYDNHHMIATLWNGYLHNHEQSDAPRKALQASDVANMMELLKIARRQTGGFNGDDYVDGAGYAGVAFECAKVERGLTTAAAAPSTNKFDAFEKGG